MVGEQWVKHFWFAVCFKTNPVFVLKLISNKGGLHNRLTQRIRLLPFKLDEVKKFLKKRHINYSNQQLLQVYMAVGGVPYYLNYLERGKSAIQNIDTLFFNSEGPLFGEFDILYASLFDKADIYLLLLEVIASKRYGIKRSELLEKIKGNSGGRLNQRLRELEEAGFIMSFVPYQNERKGITYQVIDVFTLFYLYWVKRSKATIKRMDKPNNYWQEKSKSTSYSVWSGYAYEALCHKHLLTIMNVLTILPGSIISAWRYSGSDFDGAQIDLLFDRDDGVITLCEIKYNAKPFVIDKVYAKNLQQKLRVFRQVTKTDKQLSLVFITVNGLKETMYAEALVDQVVLFEDLV
jgi:DNA-binding Lrp family transcriptional regulator